jgi:hypothetical protein
MLDNSDKQQLVLDLFRAYYDARNNKRKAANALAFKDNYQEKLFALADEIMDRRYVIRSSVCFVVKKPVRREVFAADFRDRVVHHLIFNYINPVFEKHFIRDSYSCRLKKGTSFGIKRVDHFIRASSENYQKDCWILKLDIKGYFMSMDRNILWRKIEKKLESLKDANFDIALALYLIHVVVFNDPTKNCRVKGKRADWVGLPKSKSLFFAQKDKGFPIGNLTSQLFGNIYLDEFDHFVREELKIKYYGRYVDDMVFVHADKEYLKAAIPKIKAYLRTTLNLDIHPKKIYFQNYRKGVKFIGAYILPYRVYIDKRTKKNFYVKIEHWNNLGRPGGGVFQERIFGVHEFLPRHPEPLRHPAAPPKNADPKVVAGFRPGFFN